MLDALVAGAADVEVGGDRLHGAALTAAVDLAAERFASFRRVAVVAAPTLQTIVTIAGAVTAGCTVVPLNPAAGEQERTHVLRDSRPDVVVDGDLVTTTEPDELIDDGRDDAALIVYTSGTTGPPKGAVLSRRAIAACLDGLAATWAWSDRDVLAHALPLFHVHGLVLGTFGPLRHGSRLVRTRALAPVADASIYFAVPTMWARLTDGELIAMTAARLLVSGSASLPAPVAERVCRLSSHRLVERYGLTESLIVTAAGPGDERRPGDVGRPLPGVELRIADADTSGLGEVQLRGPTLFDGYLHRPDATAAAHTADGWFRTGDLGRYDETTGLRLLGRLATDLIKTGGYKVGAGEVEDALLAHPAVAEVAVTGEPDADLGERIIAWVVTRESIEPDALIQHVASALAPHKRPREVRFIDALPRNAMGKIQKGRLVRPT